MVCFRPIPGRTPGQIEAALLPSVANHNYFSPATGINDDTSHVNADNDGATGCDLGTGLTCSGGAVGEREGSSSASIERYVLRHTSSLSRFCSAIDGDAAADLLILSFVPAAAIGPGSTQMLLPVLRLCSARADNSDSLVGLIVSGRGGSDLSLSLSSLDFSTGTGVVSPQAEHADPETRAFVQTA